MCKRIYLILCALIFVSSVSAQEISREQKIEELRIVAPQIEQTQAKLDELESRQEKIIEDILAVSSQDIAEAEKNSSKADRIFPDGLLNNLISIGYGDADFSSYSFQELSGSYSFPKIEYKNNSLQFKNSEESFGFITNIGGTLPETINEQNNEFIALAKYELPENLKNVENEFSSDGISFRNKVQIVVGNTYLVRAFNQWGNDGIFALRIHRKDSDGSIVLFVKLIKDFSKPLKSVTDDNGQSNLQKTPSIPDYSAQQEVATALIQKGFYNVTVEATTSEVTIRGTIPKGKMAEVMQTVTETAKRKVNNQITEER